MAIQDRDAAATTQDGALLNKEPLCHLLQWQTGPLGDTGKYLLKSLGEAAQPGQGLMT